MGNEESTDLLYGVDAISKCLNMTAAQVYHLHAQKHLPTFKIGAKVCARRSALQDWLAAKERDAASGRASQ